MTEQGFMCQGRGRESEPAHFGPTTQMSADNNVGQPGRRARRIRAL
jgi:hypothetical protein